MVDHISAEQVEAWLDDNVVNDVKRGSDEATEFNIRLKLSRLPLHIIKEDTWGPIRIVGKNGFDTDRTRALITDDDKRRELLASIGPVLAATPGFYTFLDEDDSSCEFAKARFIQLEHRIYPDAASQQALMEGLMGVATAMRYIQNTVATMTDDPVE